MQRKRSVEKRRRALWLKQKGLCALCGNPLDYDESCLDHDHACCNKPIGQACGTCDRGAIHIGCNTLLGFAHDDRELLRKAITYLDRTDT